MGRSSDARERLMQAVLDLIWAGSYGSTTIDLICDKAGVKKGSFYHFFESKSELAVASLDQAACGKWSELNGIFSPMVPPLERLKRHCELMYQEQVKLHQELGYVLGCPLFTLGSEVSTQEAKLRAKVDELLAKYLKFYETAIRDAQAAGEIAGGDVTLAARNVLAYHEGLLTQARIQNDPELLRQLPHGTLALLGARPVASLPV